MWVKGCHRSVLVVDDESSVAEVMARSLAQQGYQSHVVLRAREALQELGQNEYQAVLTDIRMPEKDGFWLLEQIGRLHPEVAVLMLTGLEDTNLATECFQRGALDYVLKSQPIAEVMSAVEKAISKREHQIQRDRDQKELHEKVRKRNGELRSVLSQLEKAYYGTLVSLVTELDRRQHEAADHSYRVVNFCVLFAERLNLTKSESRDVAIGALLHDVGKVCLNEGILKRDAKLSKEELAELKSHPEKGCQMLECLGFLANAAEIILTHHEHFDGSGYPRGLAGMQIPLGARIFAIATTLDDQLKTLNSRSVECFEEAKQEIIAERGRKFDPLLVDLFASIPAETWMQADSQDEYPFDFLRRVSESISRN